MVKLGCYVPVFVLISWLEAASGGLLVNEVMSNEPGSNRMLEWIELWNYSDSPFDLNGFSFNDEDPAFVFGDSTVLQPHEYIVIARSAEEFEAHWGDGSGTWGDSDNEHYRVLCCRMSLRNEADTVSINDESGAAVSFCLWTSSSPDGVSLERCDPRHGEESAVWLNCRSPDGSTPGARNSRSPSGNDLELIVEFGVLGDYRDQLEALITLRNVGLSRSDSNELRLGIDPDGNMILDEPDVVFSYPVPPLPIYDSLAVHTVEEFGAGLNFVLVTLLGDDNPDNNDTVAAIRFGLQPFEVVINEILPDPAPPFETEWIELYNVSERVVDLEGWSLCDCVGCVRLENVSINAEGYLVLCQDAEAFRAFYDPNEIEIASPNGWRSLNNDGDNLHIVDRTGTAVDSMLYESGMGNNVSLERIDPYAVGYEPSNWYKSTSPHGSTPGEPNSVRDGFLRQLRIELDSKIISPDGDGVDDVLTIRYDIPKGTELSLRVFDLNGLVVRTIFEGERGPSGEYSYLGITDDGRPLEIGMYILLAELSGKTEASRKFVFAIVGRE